MNRKISETCPDLSNNTIFWSYDMVGNVMMRTDQKSQVTNYTYSDLYFLLSRSYPSGTDSFTYQVCPEDECRRATPLARISLERELPRLGRIRPADPERPERQDHLLRLQHSRTHAHADVPGWPYDYRAMGLPSAAGQR